MKRSSLAGRERHNCPLAAPSPLPAAGVAAAVRQGLQPLILTRLEADDDVRLAGAQSEDVDAGAGAEVLDGFREGRRGVPVSLKMCQLCRISRAQGNLHRQLACGS